VRVYTRDLTTPRFGSQKLSNVPFLLTTLIESASLPLESFGIISRDRPVGGATMGLVGLAETDMGRPRRKIPTTSIKIEEDANELVRKAATFLGMSVVDYASGVLRERAMKDLKEGAKKFLLENQEPPLPSPAPSPKKPSRKGGDHG
jgi:hypothetical protein